jgi:hypothetical protein
MDWRTYHDTAFGFSILYPSTYTLLTEPATYANTAPPLLHRVRFQEQDLVRSAIAALEPARFSIEVFANPTALPLLPWLEHNGMLPPHSDLQPFPIAERAGIRVLRRELVAPGQFIFVDNNRWVYRLTPLGPYADAMLRSFRCLP